MSKSADGGRRISFVGEIWMLETLILQEIFQRKLFLENMIYLRKKWLETIIWEVSCRQKGPKVVWNHFIPSESWSNINFSIFTQTAADKNSANLVLSLLNFTHTVFFGAARFMSLGILRVNFRKPSRKSECAQFNLRCFGFPDLIWEIPLFSIWSSYPCPN